MRLYNPVDATRVVTDDLGVRKYLLEGMVPSVTEILGIVNEGEYLTRWFIKESLEYYKSTGNLNAAIEYRNTTSADYGTVCHGLAETYLTGKECEEKYTSSHVKTIAPFKRWADKNIDEVLFAEKFFADSELGYGGTADMLLKLNDGRVVLADLKFKKDRKNYPMKPTINYMLQLTAYRNHFKKEYGEMETMNLLLRSPFGTYKEPKLKAFYYRDRDWTRDFDRLKQLWWFKHTVDISDVECEEVD